MKHKKYGNLSLATLLVVISVFQCGHIYAQSGNFIQFWGGPQYVGIENFSDYSATNLSGQQNIVPTYKVGAGMDYIHNFNTNYGLQTGLYYSGVGQKYTGTIRDFYNIYSTHDSIPYTSHVYMDYIRVPFLLRFNSEIAENSRINVSIFMGFQLGYLMNVKVFTRPNAPDSILKNYPNFNFKQLYNPIDFGLTAGAEFNIKIRDWEYAHIGVRFDRSITNIENTNYVLPGNAPVEWMYPVSTKKDERASHDDVLAGFSSQYISLNVFVGMSFRVKQITPPQHIIRDDDNNSQ